MQVSGDTINESILSHRKENSKKFDHLAEVQINGFNELRQEMHENVQSNKEISGKLDNLTQVQIEKFRTLNDTISTGLDEIASLIEWGFSKIEWQLQLQANILLAIDHTLKTPIKTQAEEWRQMADELMYRGVFDEAQKFYTKALESNPLDYRIYIGLSQNYLQSNTFDKAKALLEKSLSHAPKKEIDYKSYSYRLIGHIYACEESYGRAIEVLRTAIELSPKYADGLYDYAQYCAKMGKTEFCLSSLRQAIVLKPLYWYLAQKERNFESARSVVQKLLIELIPKCENGFYNHAQYCAQLKAIEPCLDSLRQAIEEKPQNWYLTLKDNKLDPVRGAVQKLLIGVIPKCKNGFYDHARYCAQLKVVEPCLFSLRQAILLDPQCWYLAQKAKSFNPIRNIVQQLLKEIYENAYIRAKNITTDAEKNLSDAVYLVEKATKSLKWSGEIAQLKSREQLTEADSNFREATSKTASGDYVASLEAVPLAHSSLNISVQALEEALREHKYYRRIFIEKLKDAFDEPSELFRCLISRFFRKQYLSLYQKHRSRYGQSENF